MGRTIGTLHRGRFDSLKRSPGDGWNIGVRAPGGVGWGGDGGDEEVEVVEVLTGVRSWNAVGMALQRAFYFIFLFFFNSGGLLVFDLVLIRCVFVRKVGPVNRARC